MQLDVPEAAKVLHLRDNGSYHSRDKLHVTRLSGIRGDTQSLELDVFVRLGALPLDLQRAVKNALPSTPLEDVKEFHGNEEALAVAAQE